MEGLDLYFPGHCYFLYPEVQFSLKKDASEPVEDIKASSILTVHVISQYANISIGKGHFSRSPRATSCALGHEL